MKGLILATTLFLGAAIQNTALAQHELEGDVRLACEAVLCLAGSVRPAECSPSLSRYYGIKHRKWSDTLKGRLNFLKMCPVSHQTPAMSSFVHMLSRASGQCDTESLNLKLRNWRWDEYLQTEVEWISSQMPAECSALYGHEYTRTSFNTTLPKYVGDEDRGGHWVDAKDYEEELLKYRERIEREDYERNGGNVFSGRGWLAR